MATITSTWRFTQILLAYPTTDPAWDPNKGGTGKGGWRPELCGCAGVCSGGKGPCQKAKAALRLVVAFTLDDGRSGAVDVDPAATDAVITSAISAWATANPIPARPLAGTLV